MDRTFKDLRTPSGKDDAFELSWGERFDESGVSWDDLLKSQRILIVSEAGAGKTYECESKARTLRSRRACVFPVARERCIDRRCRHPLRGRPDALHRLVGILVTGCLLSSTRSMSSNSFIGRSRMLYADLRTTSVGVGTGDRGGHRSTSTH